MAPRYSIHPAIGIARLGNSPTEFNITPETPRGLPLACDGQGNTTTGADGKEATTTAFKDAQGRIKREAARFRVFVYDEKNPDGRELKIGDEIDGVTRRGKLVDIEWHVYLANKKASWYEFKELEGEHGYGKKHPLRNADVTGAARQQLVIDPGQQMVDGTDRRRAEFARGKNPGYAQTFPPPLDPTSIDTLGEILTDDHHHLLVLGGHGNSGSYLQGFGNPGITDFANNDGWFDDIADGPVSARLKFWDEEDQEYNYVTVNDPAWVLTAYPSYAPEIPNIVTLDEVLYDLAVRELAYDTYMYGTGPFDQPQEVDASDPAALSQWRLARKRWNPDYYPFFWSQIWPILNRPTLMQWVTNFLVISNDPHETGAHGNFQQDQISVPPKNGEDPYRAKRMYIWGALRKAGFENAFRFTADPESRLQGAPLMPLLCGDNPLTNTVPSKFLRLTDTMLFLLHQWAVGKFINEKDECLDPQRIDPPEGPGRALDRGMLFNALGGSFCPGGEVCWIIRNPTIYSGAYRLHADPDFLPNMAQAANAPVIYYPNVERQLSLGSDLAKGLQPGDLTKYSAVPWQADFNECSTQPIDVTYPEWNKIQPKSTDDTVAMAKQATNLTLWWPAHRPMQVYQQLPGPPDQPAQYVQINWARGVPQTNAGDLKMVTVWPRLGFVVKNSDSNPSAPAYVEVEAGDQD